MTTSYSLAIPKMPSDLNILECSGFYWINYDNQNAAQTLTQQILENLSDKDKAIFISSEEHKETLLNKLQRIAFKKLPLFSIPANPTALDFLSSDLERALKFNHYFIIFSTTNAVWSQFNKEALQKWVTRTRIWLNRLGTTLLILNYEQELNSIHTRLAGSYDRIKGMSSLTTQIDQLIYNIHWWGGEQGINVNQRMTLQIQDHKIKVKEIDIKQDVAHFQNDESMYWVEHTVLEGAPPLSDYWKLLKDNEEVAKIAENAQAATVIFSISEGAELIPLAKLIYTLRIHCGNALKIVVREMSNRIRFSDEEVLLNCGATLCIPHGVGLSKFLIMVAGIQGQHFTRTLPAEIDEYLHAFRPLQKKGYLQNSEFIHEVLHRMDNPYLPRDGKGVLIVLTPLTTIKAAQDITLCELKRLGDISTLFENQIYLFFSTCSLSDVDIALKNVFRLPINELFASQTARDKDLQITTEVKRLDLEKTQMDPLVSPEEIPEALPMHHEKKRVRITPRDLNLSLSDKEIYR